MMKNLMIDFFDLLAILGLLTIGWSLYHFSVWCAWLFAGIVLTVIGMRNREGHRR